ncbi:MAG: MBL fold metallo-hydrolase [Saprospiraceae bacterium]|nr:MBL fold metallo-hydrolase [Saprospiraceae bacterium]
MKWISVFILIFFLQNVDAQTDLLVSNDGDIQMTPITHATLVLQWDHKTIYIDPYGGSDKFTPFPPADLICITHPHGDHLNQETLRGLDLTKAILVAPQAVIDELGDIKFKEIVMLSNGEESEILGLTVQAVPMYNLPDDDSSRHPKGWGNGYVLTIGGDRLYFSGDTEDIPEMRMLSNIDYAFVCMNLPYTMDVDQAADAVLDFAPKVVYPYHYRGQGGLSDVEKFKSLVNAGNPAIEVRLRNWYP